MPRTSPSEPGAADGAPRGDLRLLLPAVSAWGGALVGVAADPHRILEALVAMAVLALAVALVPALGVGRRGRGRDATVGVLLASAVLGATVTLSAAVRAEAIRSGPVAHLASRHAQADVALVITGDPRVREGRFGTRVFVPARVRALHSEAGVTTVSTGVLVAGDVAWSDRRLGEIVRVHGRLSPGGSGDVAGVLSPLGEPEVTAPPPWVLTVADSVRASVRSAASAGPDPADALVPALVVGDDARLDSAVQESFRTAGLTHLTAVSGTNLTLVVGFLLALGGYAGVTGRGRVVLGLLGVAGFVLLARPEPSVLRAAVMGGVALLGLGAGGRGAGFRALGAAMVLLLLIDPWLGRSAGFALSVLATAGILLFGPGFRDALAGWMPRWCAEALAVPLAAQIACTPLVAALSGQVSLVAVLANVVVAPAVGPATVLGLGGGLVRLAVPPVGSALGWLACLGASWIVTVAAWSSSLPLAAVAWGTGAATLGALSLLCTLALLGGGRLLARPAVTVPVSLLLGAAMLWTPPSPGWPPRGWILVACDVGQGDALVVRAGPATAVVVDAGPDPALVDRCLRGLGVTRVPLVLLTHFHADHVDGLSGVLAGRVVGEVEATTLEEPAGQVAEVKETVRRSGVELRTASYGERATVGELTWQVIAPSRDYPGSPNDSSVVVLLEVRGLRVLLTGDVEPPAQRALLRRPGLAPVDVLKVPHHGSRYQDPRMLRALGARIALISVGEDNDYGHPARATVAALREAGAVVGRTDVNGDLAVVVRDGRLAVVGLKAAVRTGRRGP